MRAVSTVVDVSLFLLLVGAAVSTLALADRASVDGPAVQPDPADELLEQLATSTTRVNYSVGPALAEAGGTRVDTGSAVYSRSAHGSYAELLAAAAVASATVGDDGLTVAGDPFARAVAGAVEPAIGRTHLGTRVRAVWRPYADAALHGTVRIGGRPPSDADVRSATLRVDSGLGPRDSGAFATAGSEGFGALATVLANRTVEGLFPGRVSRVALRGDSPADRLVAARYVRASRALGVSGGTPPRDHVDPARERLRGRLRARFEQHLRAQYDDPVAAASEVRIGRVTVLVRTWSA